MPIPRTRVMVGVQRKDGVAEIVPMDFPCDMGDHGRVSILKTIAYFSFNTKENVEAIFSYCNIKTGNCVYCEV